MRAFLESYADYLMAHLEEWTVSSKGYFVRLNPAKPGEVAEPGDVDKAILKLTSQPPGSPSSFPANEIVDAGFLQLVRYGILAADDPVVLKSVQVVDEKLRVELPGGSSWRRYNHDGYGQQPDGGPYKNWGIGRCWPLLTGERAHYELAAGGDYRSLIAAMEAFGAATGLLPEQIWDVRRPAGRTYVSWRAHRFRGAVGVGAFRIPAAASLLSGQSRVRPHTGGEAKIPREKAAGRV